jgi:aspartyl-tRNA(Asn)/glutamyl-tRNA(Gln) amidotransferase subunit C
MSVSKEEIMHIAKLADLNLTDAEIERYSKDMNEILDFANMINSVDTSNVKETIGANEKYNVFRKDEVKAFENTEKLLQNAPSKDEGMFNIPKVIN